MRIKLEASFQRDFKQLRKKYPSLPSDLANLGESLKENPQQ
jgi:mRNA-degrading endonuclease YafQ of YafQ-DinJ toxin-antitoxin module